MGLGARLRVALWLLGVAAFCGYGVLASAELDGAAWSWRLGYGTVGCLALGAAVQVLRQR